MFYSVNGKIAQVGEAFLERKNNSLTFEVEGETFPDPYLRTLNTRIELTSSTPNSLVINYGDGTVVTENFESIGDEYKMLVKWDTLSQSLGLIPKHTYQDSNTGPRFITFNFLELQSIRKLIIQDVKLINRISENINSIKLLENLSLIRVANLTELNLNLPDNIRSIDFQRIGSVMFNKIPDSIFNTKVNSMLLSGIFDFQDNITSNLFKLNQLSSTLTSLRLSSLPSVLPEELFDCKKITSLQISGSFNVIDDRINQLKDLSTLYYTSDKTDVFELANFNSLNKLGTIVISVNTADFSTMSENWSGLKSLFRFFVFRRLVRTTQKFNEFTENFYTLCTENGFLDPSSTEAQNTGFPEQFRDISWGDTNDWFTVTNTIQAPSGFSLGISNGTPANNAEKIYVLIENYGHTVELAP
jgi:hypothetical protein